MALITVLLPVYNAETYLEECLKSLEKQTFEDFNVLILEDGCTDNSEEVALKFQEKDKRFQWFPRKENLGISKTLNQGLKLADGEYIAIMNADDINHLQRFKKQLKFIQQENDIISCGTQIQCFDNRGTKWEYRVPTKPNDIFAEWIYRPALIHATSLTRRKAFENLSYSLEFWNGLDYQLWSEIILKGKMANLNEVLYFVRSHEEQVSKEIGVQKINKKKVFKIWLNRLEISPSEDDLDLHFEIFSGKDKIDINYLERVGEWLAKLYLQNQKTKIFPEPHFTNLLKKTWAKHTLGFSRLGLPLWNIWKDSPLSERLLTNFQRQKFWLKCLLKIYLL